MAAAIRLAKKGYDVVVFEKNKYPGGKLSEFSTAGYRFDKGPSLLTMPDLIDELTVLSGYKTAFNYTRLKTITHYFFEDGTKVVAQGSAKELAKELKVKLNEDEEAVIKHLAKSKFYHSNTSYRCVPKVLVKLRSQFFPYRRCCSTSIN